MAFTEIKGKVVTINQASHILYSVFSDLRNFTAALPQDKKEGIIATENTLEGKVKGFDLGIKIANKVPFTIISFEPYGKVPFNFAFSVFFDVLDIQKTNFHIELAADLNYMLKMMIGSKLQDMVDQMIEQIAGAFNGNLPNNVDFQDFLKSNGSNFN